MTLKVKFFWGVLAGFAIVLVKIIGPDQALVKSFFQPILSADAAFYIFIALITAILGGLSGLFTEEQSPGKLLIFCASFPALLSTYASQDRSVIPPEAPSEQVETGPASSIFPQIITSAYAQSNNSRYDCKEASFSRKFTNSAQRYLKRESYANQPYFSVVVAATKDLEQAKTIALAISNKDRSFAPYVGCRKPGNRNFPIIIGKMGKQIDAWQLKGRFEATKLFRQKSYLSFYEYRKPIFRP